MGSVEKYLVSAMADRNEATLVMLGNEAADLDSMASSVACGYLYNLLNDSDRELVVPVMPIPRRDFQLRTEAVCVFREAGIALESLVFVDDVNFDRLMVRGAGLFLLDHNRLAPKFEQYSSNVCGIIDHHVDEGVCRGAEPRIVQNVGSTASLVGQNYHRLGIEIPQEIATLLAGTILLDTVNLDERAGRVTELDREVAESLFPLLSISRNTLFDKVQREKNNVFGLSTVDLLRKDFKEFQVRDLRYGIASTRLSIEQWQNMDSKLCRQFANFAASRKLDVLISMNSFADPHFCRELMVYCRNAKVYDRVCRKLQELPLKLLSHECSGYLSKREGFVRFYHQGNSRVSRKILHPLLAEE